jgi:hypothetical protein
LIAEHAPATCDCAAAAAATTKATVHSHLLRPTTTEEAATTVVCHHGSATCIGFTGDVEPTQHVRRGATWPPFLAA